MTTSTIGWSVNMHVRMTAPCPACGADATWHGHRENSGMGTRWSAINCPQCDHEKEGEQP